MPDLIALADLQTVCGLNSQVEARKVVNGIADAHRALKKVLGSTGYELVYATPGDYTELIAYTKPYMCWYAMEKSYPDLFAEADRAGVHVKTDPNSGYQAVSASQLSMKVNAARDRAESFLEELIHYLINNPSLYAWYGTNVDGEQRIGTSTRTSGGFSLRRSRRQDSYRG